MLILAGVTRPGLLCTEYLLCTRNVLWEVHKCSRVSLLAGTALDSDPRPQHVTPKPLVPPLSFTASERTSFSWLDHQTLSFKLGKYKLPNQNVHSHLRDKNRILSISSLHLKDALKVQLPSRDGFVLSFH